MVEWVLSDGLLCRILNTTVDDLYIKVASHKAEMNALKASRDILTVRTRCFSLYRRDILRNHCQQIGESFRKVTSLVRTSDRYWPLVCPVPVANHLTWSVVRIIGQGYVCTIHLSIGNIDHWYGTDIRDVTE